MAIVIPILADPARSADLATIPKKLIRFSLPRLASQEAGESVSIMLE